MRLLQILLWKVIFKLNGLTYYPIGGGKGKDEETTIIQPEPAPKPPSASEIAQESAKAQLQYTPEMYEAYWEAQQKYAPLQAEQALQLQQQYAPQLQELYQSMYPQQSQVIEAMAGQALEKLSSPTGMTAGQQEAQRGIREEAVGGLQRAIQTSANLGGGLYGGRRERREDRAVSDMQRAFESEDYTRQLQQQYTAMQQAVPLMQILYPQIQQPQVPNLYQQTTPSADSIYGAYAQRAAAQQPQVFYNPATPSPMWDIAGSFAGGAGAGLTGGWMAGLGQKGKKGN